MEMCEQETCIEEMVLMFVQSLSLCISAVVSPSIKPPANVYYAMWFTGPTSIDLIDAAAVDDLSALHAMCLLSS